MKNNQWITLIGVIAVGLIWIFAIQSEIFLNLFSGPLLIPGEDLQDFLDVSVSPAFKVYWFGCISAVMLWIGRTLNKRPSSSKETRSMQMEWWISAGILLSFGLITLGWYITFQFWMNKSSPYELSTYGWLLLAIFIVIDGLILFWMPTLLSTPRNFRLVVPGAVKLLGNR